MQLHQLLASALLVLLVTPEVQSEICQRGWFGDNCSFQCQCQGSRICGRNGECPNFGDCNFGYFGPACQYLDLVSINGSPSNNEFYRDGNDSSCNSLRNGTSVSVSLEFASAFMWIRVVVKEDRYLLNFSLQLNGNQACSNQRRYIVNSRTVDITCDNNKGLKTFTIKSLATQYICSILVSAGRNVALKETAIQSPETAGQINSPSNAVDGNRDNVYENKSCSYTTGAQQPWWLLTFQRPKIVLMAIIYNRNTLMSRIDGFKLETYSAQGNRTNYYVNTGESGLIVYSIILTSQEPITSVKIISGSLFLTMCEVLLLGDTACPEGRYGFSCEHTCSCKVSEVCSIVTGLCAPGCPTGTYGLNCSSQCSSQCYGGGCSPHKGDCFSCFPGFTGARCQEPCEAGSYGHQCSTNCSEHCVDVCNNQNGVCKCNNNNTGANCTDKLCPIGFYGTHCTNTCSEFCYQRECLVVTGECIKCHGFREGRYCEDCPPKSFGMTCQKACSEYCVNATCDKDSGNCPSCTNGYSGTQCSTGPIFGISTYWLFALPVPLTVLTCVLAFFFGKKKTRVASLDNEDETEG